MLGAGLAEDLPTAATMVFPARQIEFPGAGSALCGYRIGRPNAGRAQRFRHRLQRLRRAGEQLLMAPLVVLIFSYLQLAHAQLYAQLLERCLRLRPLSARLLQIQFQLVALLLLLVQLLEARLQRGDLLL